MLVLKNIQKRFGKSDPILCNVNISFDKNNVSCIVGANGAGKTTLLNIISSLMFPNKGDIHLNGKSILEHIYLRNKIFYVPVQPFFYEKLSAKDNLYLISNLYEKKVSEESIHHVSNEVGLKISDLSRPVQNFSSGMKQKLNFASMLLVNTPVILLDEPFNALDQYTQLIFSKLLKKLAFENKTIIFTSHLPSTILELADDLYFLKNGTIVDQKKANFFDQDSLEEWLLNMQSEEDTYEKK